MASTNATINLLVSGVNKLDQLVEKASKLEGIANRLSTTPLDFSRSSAARNLENIENKMYTLKKITEDTGKEIADTQKLIDSYSQRVDKAQQRLARLKNPETPTYKKLTAEINESAQALERLTDKLGELGRTRATASSAKNIFKPILNDAQSSKRAIDALQDLADAYTQFGDIRKRNALGRITGDVGLGASVSQIREQAAALSLVSNNVKVASSDFNKFTIAVEGANRKLAEAEQQRFRALAYGLSPQGPRQNVGRLPMPGSTESAVAGSRKLVASALAMNDTIVRSEAAMGSYLSYLEQLKSLVPAISNEYRALEERIAGVRDEMSGFGLRGQSMKIQPQLGPATRLDDPRSVIKKQAYYDKIESQLNRIAALETRVDQAYLSQNQKLELRQKLDKAASLLAERDLTASKRQTVEIDRQRMSLERLNRRGTPMPVTQEERAASTRMSWGTALAQMEEIAKQIELEARQKGRILKIKWGSALAQGAEIANQLSAEADRKKAKVKLSWGSTLTQLAETASELDMASKARSGAVKLSWMSALDGLSSIAEENKAAQQAKGARIKLGWNTALSQLIETAAILENDAASKNAKIKLSWGSALAQGAEIGQELAASVASRKSKIKMDWNLALAMAQDVVSGAAKSAGRGAGAGATGRIRPSNIRTTDISPLDAPKRLENIIRSGELLQERLVGAQGKGVDIGDRLVRLQSVLNSAKSDTFEISAKNLDILDDELNTTRQLLALQKERTANAKAEAVAAQQLAKRVGRGQLDRGTLTSILGDLGRSDVATKVFRGGRSGERALSNIIENFNRVTAPLRQQATARGQDMPAYSGPEAGREREIDRYRGIFAGLTNNPRFFNRLLQQLPREAITTTMAGRASDISRAIEDSRRPDRKALESSIRLAYKEATGRIPSAVTELFDRIGSVFDSIANRVTGGTGGIGGGGGRRPPIPLGGAGPEDFPDRINAARGDTDRLLGLKDLANLSAASANQLELLSQALSETRNGLKMTDKGFDQLTKVLNKVDDQIARRDPNADFLTRRFGQRGGQAVGEGLIGGAFPLLFGQGLGAAIGGGLGGGLGGFAGGTLGFGLSLAGTALGSAFDTLVQTTQDTGNVLRDLTGNFEQIKESGLLASRNQEKLIATLLESGNKTAAYSVIQDELNRKIGVDGASKLKEAADAGDRMKRAMADLGVQLQLFIAGPLADFLNKLAEGLEKRNEGARRRSIAGEAYDRLPFEGRKSLLQELAAANIAAGANPQANKVRYGNYPVLGAVSVGPGGSSEGRSDMFQRLTSNLSPEQVTKIVEGFAPRRPPTAQERRDAAIRNAETGRGVAQRQLEAFNKSNEGFDILRGFKQQANAARREQEDIDRQSFELRRDYEKQIEDIRRGVEEKIAQLRQENAQKELEILVKQGQIREQQFKNAAAALQGALAGDPLAQSLADAVTTYLGAQLSAQNEIEQRRKQFEIEISSQQIEIEKYKAEVARSVGQLNLSTAEKVQEINRNVARRNEDAALNVFATEKETARLKAEVIKNELLTLRAKQADTVATARGSANLSPQSKELDQIAKIEEERYRKLQDAVESAREQIKEITKLQAPPRLRGVAFAPVRGVSTAGVDRIVARGNQLRDQFRTLSEELTGLAKAGNLLDFTKRISEISFGEFDELSNNLKSARRELALLGGDFASIADIITASYQEVIDALPDIVPAQLKNQIPALARFIEQTRQSQVALEKLRPTLEFYIDGYGDLKTQTEQAKNGISELLSPTKSYDRLLEQINKRGGLGINDEENRRLLEAAKNLDELNAKLKVLNGLNEIAGGWTDSFIQFNKELLKGGNLLESVQRFAEGVADRTLDVVLEFTLRPIQEQLFKNLAKVFGIEAPQDPTLLPIQETAKNTRDIAILMQKRFANQTGITIPDMTRAANSVVPGPSSAQSMMRPGMTPANQAWLDTISFAEGTWDSTKKSRRYDIGFGFNRFDNTKPHPERVWSSGGYSSAASGAYQFMPSTWRMVNQGQNPAMLPATQDAAALNLIQRRGVNPNQAISQQAVSKLAPEWASFPASSGGSFYGQPFKEYSVLEKFFMERLNFYNNQFSPIQPAPTPAGQRTSKLPIGDQFLAQIIGGQFEDVAGLQPLPLERMYRQMGRQVQRWTNMVQNEAEYFLKKTYGTRKPLIPQDIIDSTIDRVRVLTNTIQSFDPLEAQFRELENSARGRSGNARSRLAAPSLEAIDAIFSDIRDKARDTARRAANRAGSSFAQLGGLTQDLSDFLTDGQRKILSDAIKQASRDSLSRSFLETRFGIDFGTLFRESANTADPAQGRLKGGRGAAGGRDSLALPDLQRSPSGGIDYLRQYREIQELMEPPRITPGVESQFDGAMLNIGNQFVEMLANAGSSIIASAQPTGLFADRLGGRRAYPLPADYPYPAGQNAPTQSTPAAAMEAAKPVSELGAEAKVAAEGIRDFGAQASDSVTKFQRTVGAGLQAISSIAMGVGGVQMIRKGGAYNTLMGAASIFGSISSITGMFGTGGVLSGLFGGGAKSLSGVAGTVNSKGLGIIGPNFGIKQFARGGRPDPYELALVGENGPEIWMPDRPGTIIPNEDIYVPILDDKGSSTPPIGRYARRNAGSADSSEDGSTETIYTGNYGRTVPYQRSETTREIDRLERITTNPKELPPIKYETTRVNEYDFVTPEQLEASNARTAKIARNQTIRELADSMKTRKRLGL